MFLKNLCKVKQFARNIQTYQQKNITIVKRKSLTTGKLYYDEKLNDEGKPSKKMNYAGKPDLLKSDSQLLPTHNFTFSRL